MVLYCDDWCFDPYSHHDKKTFEFKAYPARNNVASNSRGYFAMKNLRSGGHAKLVQLETARSEHHGMLQSQSQML